LPTSPPPHLSADTIGEGEGLSQKGEEIGRSERKRKAEIILRKY
jgi:hypothetical protein